MAIVDIINKVHPFSQMICSSTFTTQASLLQLHALYIYTQPATLYVLYSQEGIPWGGVASAQEGCGVMGVWFEKERDADVSRGSTLNGLPEGRDTQLHRQ